MKFRYKNLIAAIFCLLVVQSIQAADPVYNGKPLSEWLLVLELQRSGHDDQIPAGMEQPKDAIQRIGTNAIPTLLEILGATEKNKGWVLFKLKSSGFRKMYGNSVANIDDLTDVAVDGFGILGTNAVSAIPQISKLLRNLESCSPAAQALAELGPTGFAALTNGFSSENADIRGVTIWAIGEKSSVDSKTVARLMISCLNDPEPQNRAAAARYLRGKDPAMAIPALLPLLDENTNYALIEYASLALSSYGAAAEVAIPKLLSLYTNSWNIQLMWAIRGIDMNAAAKAEAFLVNSGPLNGARSGYTTTMLPNGKELIVGGVIHTEIPKIVNRTIASAELLDPTTGKWTETGKMNFERYEHQAVLQHDGKVLVTGGYKQVALYIRTNVSSAELYDPATEKWTLITNK